MMLGVYDYTVVLTYVSVLISMGGMLFSVKWRKSLEFRLIRWQILSALVWDLH